MANFPLLYSIIFHLFTPDIFTVNEEQCDEKIEICNKVFDFTHNE